MLSTEPPISRNNPFIERMTKLVTPDWTVRLWRRPLADPITATIENNELPLCLERCGKTTDADRAAREFFSLPTLTAVEVTDANGNGVVEYVEPFAD